MRWFCSRSTPEEVCGIDGFLQSLAGSGAPWLYLIVFFSCLVENLFPPYPGDTIVLLAGYLSGVGRLHPAVALLSSLAGSLSGASILFFLGSSRGRAVFVKGTFRFLSSDRLDRVESWFGQYGKKVVLASRFMPGVRSLVAATAGIARMPGAIFFPLSLTSILVWNGLLLFLGWRLGQNWAEVVRWFRVYNWVMVFLVMLVILFWTLRRWGLHRPGRNLEKEEKEPS